MMIAVLTSATTRVTRGTCADGSAESKPLAVSLRSARCDSTVAGATDFSCDEANGMADGEGELDFFQVKGESTAYVASGFTITEDATFYLDDDGEIEIVQEDTWCVVRLQLVACSLFVPLQQTQSPDCVFDVLEGQDAKRGSRTRDDSVPLSHTLGENQSFLDQTFIKKNN